MSLIDSIKQLLKGGSGGNGMDMDLQQPVESEPEMPQSAADEASAAADTADDADEEADEKDA